MTRVRTKKEKKSEQTRTGFKIKLQVIFLIFLLPVTVGRLHRHQSYFVKAYLGRVEDLEMLHSHASTDGWELK